MPDRRTIPIIALIVLCGLVFLFQQTDPLAFSFQHGAVPEIIAAAYTALIEGQHLAAAWHGLGRLVTAIFLHGSFEHILYNMVFFWIFGSLLAHQLGPWWTLLFFLLSGIIGNVTQVLLNLDSTIPIIGASGGISGLQGVYLGLALCWQLPQPDVWPLAYPIAPLQLALFAVAGFVFDFYALMNHQQDVAYGAHVGGFLSGLVIAMLVTRLVPQRP